MVLFLKAEIHVIVRSLATTLSPMQNLSHCLNPDIIYTTLCSLQQTYYIHNWSNNVVHMQLISYIHNVGRWRQLTHENLVLTNQTKLTLTVAQTLTDTVTVIFLTHISSTPMKRLYRNNKRNFCGGAVAGFVDIVTGFEPFSDFLPVCWQEFDSKFILYRWKEGFLWGYIRKRG